MAKGRRWTTEEDEFLIEKWGVNSLKFIAKKLNRTVKAVRVRATRLELGEFHKSGELLMFTELVEALGYSYVEEVFNKFTKRGCPIKYVLYDKKRYRKINIEKFWEWAENNQDVVNFSKFEKNSLGKEPSWVDEKRKIDKMNYANSRVLWNKEQERLLIAKAKSGKYTLRDLAIEFNRSEQSIRRKLFDLGENPIKKQRKKIRYSKEEELKILEMKEKGFDCSIIARELNRSESGIKDKYNRLIS